MPRGRVAAELASDGTPLGVKVFLSCLRDVALQQCPQPPGELPEGFTAKRLKIPMGFQKRNLNQIIRVHSCLEARVELTPRQQFQVRAESLQQQSQRGAITRLSSREQLLEKVRLHG